MTLQAWRGSAGKERASHSGFGGGERLNLLRYERLGLVRERFEEKHQGANLVVGEKERRHAYGEIAAHAVAIQIGGAESRVGKEVLEPVGIDASAFAGEHRRQIDFVLALVHGQSHEHGLLPNINLMAAHAVVLGDDPPALLDGGAVVR